MTTASQPHTPQQRWSAATRSATIWGWRRQLLALALTAAAMSGCGDPQGLAPSAASSDVNIAEPAAELEPAPVEATSTANVAGTPVEETPTAHFVAAATLLGGAECGLRGIADSISLSGGTATYWRTNCGPVWCFGRVISNVDGVEPTDTGRCERGSEYVTFSGPYIDSTTLMD